jgi:hypothetical protein
MAQQWTAAQMLAAACFQSSSPRQPSTTVAVQMQTAVRVTQRLAGRSIMAWCCPSLL